MNQGRVRDRVQEGRDPKSDQTEGARVAPAFFENCQHLVAVFGAKTRGVEVEQKSHETLRVRLCPPQTRCDGLASPEAPDVWFRLWPSESQRE